VVAWEERLNTDDTRYGGSGVTNPDPVKPEDGRVRITLPPLATVWLTPFAV
jgi:1,4-alpha-glucan branching enzyme